MKSIAPQAPLFGIWAALFEDRAAPCGLKTGSPRVRRIWAPKVPLSQGLGGPPGVEFEASPSLEFGGMKGGLPGPPSFGCMGCPR